MGLHTAGGCPACVIQPPAFERATSLCLQAFRIHYGLPRRAPAGAASFARELRLVFSALPPTSTFLRPLLLPPQPELAPPEGSNYLVPLDPGSRRYIYPPPYEEQFNAQRFALMELM